MSMQYVFKVKCVYYNEKCTNIACNMTTCRRAIGRPFRVQSFAPDISSHAIETRDA